MSTEAMTQVPLEGITDEQLYSDANSDEPVADEAPPEPAAEPVEQDGQPRDEAGRFQTCGPGVIPSEDHVFVSVVHHIISDGWSMRVMRTSERTSDHAPSTTAPRPSSPS